MKGYPVSRDELFGLGSVGLLATLCFSGGFSYLKNASDIARNLEFAKGTTEKLPDKLVTRWETKGRDDHFFGEVLIAIGIFAVLGGGAKIWSIIKSTKHGER